MTKRAPSNVAASVRHRLLNVIRQSGDDANFVWSRYATERLLYRISVSQYAGDFILKGALLFVVWTGESGRPTADLDLLGHGSNDSARIARVFRSLCRADVVADGLVFDADSVRVAPIREETEYQGRRVTLRAFLGKSRIHVQVDVAFGDVVTPRAKMIRYPVLLDLPAPRIRACPRETVIAEKLQAMVALGIANSRMKDFYDLYVLARDFEFEGETLARAIKATFRRRRTAIPSEAPLALTGEFGRDRVKAAQWSAFVGRSGLENTVPRLPGILSRLRRFLLAPLAAASGLGPAKGVWRASGKWNWANR